MTDDEERERAVAVAVVVAVVAKQCLLGGGKRRPQDFTFFYRKIGEHKDLKRPKEKTHR